MNRRLARLAAEVAGFSASVGIDEEGTVRAYKRHVSALEEFESEFPDYVTI